MRTLATLLLIGACGGGGTATTTPCGTDRCAADETCDMTDPAGPTCIPSDGDLDGDGIPNAMDFCEHAPGGKYDEDGDGIGDECDRCPIAKPPATPDPDGDDVDSPCDPDPHTPGDVIVAFSGFHFIPPTWKPLSPAAWQVQGGELVVTPGDATTEETLTIPITATSSQVAILAQWRVDRTLASTPAGSGLTEAAVAALDKRPAGIAQMHCGSLRDTIGDHLRLDTNSSTATKDMTNLFDSASLYSVIADIEGANVGCALVADNDRGAIQAAITPDAMSEAYLVARGAVVRFQYVLVVARNPTGNP